MFEDEFGSAFSERLGRTWAPCGQTPALRRVGYFRHVLSTIVGLTASGRIFKLHFRRAITGTEIVRVLAHFRQHLKGPFIVIWDGVRPHLAGKVKAYVAQHPEIEIEPLPGYAPELNPEEYCHGAVKRKLRNMLPDDVDQLQHLIDREFMRLRRRPDVLLGCIHHAGLSLRHLTNFRIAQ